MISPKTAILAEKNKGALMPRAIKILLGLKIIALTGFLLVQTDQIRIGELVGFAEGTIAPEQQAPKEGEIHDILAIPKLGEDEPSSRETLSRYLDVADRKRQDVVKRLEFLEKREASLKQLEATIDRKLNQLDEERKFFSASIQKETELKKERMTRLIELYDKMEPKKAATMFESLSPDLSVSLLKALKQKQLTSILEKMAPDKAAKLTEYFSRQKSGAEYDLLKEMNSSLKDAFKECKTDKALAH
jgi:flagellar motility protein MotE (MotC chaperone)